MTRFQAPLGVADVFAALCRDRCAGSSQDDQVSDKVFSGRRTQDSGGVVGLLSRAQAGAWQITAPGVRASSELTAACQSRRIIFCVPLVSP